MYKLRELRRAAFSLVLPNCYPFCDKYIGAFRYWCDSCYAGLLFLEKPSACPRYIDGMYSCCEYTGKVVEAVHRMKKGRYIYSIETFSVLMSELSGDIAEPIDIITSVPSALLRRIYLGYDHSARIAGSIASRRRMKFRRLLRISKIKTEQKTLTRKGRFENAYGMFAVISSRRVSGRSILLVDDVSTTGATLSSAAKSLKAAGAERVYALTFAKVSDK